MSCEGEKQCASYARCKFENILEQPLHNGLSKPKSIRGKGHKMINMGELFSNGRIYNIHMDRVPTTERELTASKLRKGDLLFARQSLVLEGAGKCSIVMELEEDTVYESHLIRARLNNKIADALYYYYYFNSYYGKGSIQSLVEQVAAAGIRGSDLVKLDIPLPPLYEQKTIAATLSCLDDKIELNNQMNDTLEQMAQALFKSWFVDFEPFQDGEFEDSELGKIPKGWKVGTVEELTNNIFSGGTPRTAVAEYWGGEYSWFSSGETRNPIIIGTEKKITKSGIENSSTKLAKKGSVLIASAGQGFTRGQTSLAMVDTYVNQSVVVLDIMPEYSSYLFFNLRRRYEELRGISDSSSIRGSLTTKIIRQLPILIPTLEDVLEFKKIADTIIKNMGDIQFENSTLTSLRDTLLPKLMSGEIRVPVEPAE